MSLFDAGPRANAPDPEEVAALVALGFKAERVEGWTRSRVKTYLAALSREQGVAARRAAEAERQAGREAAPAPGRGQPTPAERLVAAGYLEECLGAGADDLGQALLYSGAMLTDDEVRRVAGYYIRLFRGAA